jgi:hypothetical protein
MLASLSDARFLRHNEMRLDLNNSDPLRFQAFETTVLTAVVMIQIHLATHHLVSL